MPRETSTLTRPCLAVLKVQQQGEFIRDQCNRSKADQDPAQWLPPAVEQH